MAQTYSTEFMQESAARKTSGTGCKGDRGKSGYYAWRKCSKNLRCAENEALLKKIIWIPGASRNTYVGRKITRDINWKSVPLWIASAAAFFHGSQIAGFSSSRPLNIPRS